MSFLQFETNSEYKSLHFHLSSEDRTIRRKVVERFGWSNKIFPIISVYSLDIQTVAYYYSTNNITQHPFERLAMIIGYTVHESINEESKDKIPLEFILHIGEREKLIGQIYEYIDYLSHINHKYFASEEELVKDKLNLKIEDNNTSLLFTLKWEYQKFISVVIENKDKYYVKISFKTNNFESIIEWLQNILQIIKRTY